MRSHFLSCAFVLLASSQAFAGFIEIGATGNYRKTNIADDVTDQNLSLTGSFAYMFDQQSALELSYTKGEQKTEVGASSGNSQITMIDYAMAGLDFIYTLGAPEAVLRPYIKLGAMYIIEKKRKTYYLFSPGQQTFYAEDPALVPSAGLGFRLRLSQQLSLKVGVDGWTSKSVSKENVKVDHAARVGLSWMF